MRLSVLLHFHFLQPHSSRLINSWWSATVKWPSYSVRQGSPWLYNSWQYPNGPVPFFRCTQKARLLCPALFSLNRWRTRHSIHLTINSPNRTSWSSPPTAWPTLPVCRPYSPQRLWLRHENSAFPRHSSTARPSDSFTSGKSSCCCCSQQQLKANSSDFVLVCTLTFMLKAGNCCYSWKRILLLPLSSQAVGPQSLLTRITVTGRRLLPS